MSNVKHHWSLNDTWCIRIDSDTWISQVTRQSLSDTTHCEFSTTIYSQVRVTYDTCLWSRIDDFTTMTKCFKLCLCSLSTPDNTTDIDVKCTLELFFSNSIKWCCWCHTGIINNNIQITKVINNFLESSCYFSLFRYISYNRKCLVCWQFSNSFFCSFSIVVQYSDFKTIFNQTFCNRKTNTLTCTCNNSNFWHTKSSSTNLSHWLNTEPYLNWNTLS